MNKIFKKFFNFFKSNREIEIGEMRNYLPQGFLGFVLSHIIYKKSLPYQCGLWSIENIYFAGSTLCLDVKNDNFEDTITIDDKTFGFFIHCNSYKRSYLTQDEINKIEIIKENLKKK